MPLARSVSIHGALSPLASCPSRGSLQYGENGPSSSRVSYRPGWGDLETRHPLGAETE